MKWSAVNFLSIRLLWNMINCGAQTHSYWDVYFCHIIFWKDVCCNFWLNRSCTGSVCIQFYIISVNKFITDGEKNFLPTHFFLAYPATASLSFQKSSWFRIHKLSCEQYWAFNWASTNFVHWDSTARVFLIIQWCTVQIFVPNPPLTDFPSLEAVV